MCQVKDPNQMVYVTKKLYFYTVKSTDFTQSTYFAQCSLHILYFIPLRFRKSVKVWGGGGRATH